MSLLKKSYAFPNLFFFFSVININNIIFFLEMIPEKLTFSSLQRENNHYLILLNMVKLRWLNYPIYANETILWSLIIIWLKNSTTMHFGIVVFIHSVWWLALRRATYWNILQFKVTKIAGIVLHVVLQRFLLVLLM